MRKDIFGYYDEPTQTKPAHDPGPDGLCPVCCSLVGKHSIDNPVKTISLAVEDLKRRTRSFFFRTHRNCWDSTSPHNRMLIESSVIDECPESVGLKFSK